MAGDDQIHELLRVPSQDQSSGDRLPGVVRRARARAGQRDTLLSAIVKIWTVIARLLAPIFAQLALRRAEIVAPIRRKPDPPKN
jgi:hypothetical protein